MGLSITCRVTVGAERADARVELEGAELVVRGALRRRIPTAEMTDLTVSGGELRFVHRGVLVALAIGPAASRWLEAIRSPRSRLEKLGVHPGMRVALINLLDEAFRAELTEAGAVVSPRVSRSTALVFLGAGVLADLDRLRRLESSLGPGAAVWAVWTKGRRELNEDHIRRAAIDAGLVDVKVVRFSDTHSALKLTRRR